MEKNILRQPNPLKIKEIPSAPDIYVGSKL
jgi:hypothetical protein